MKLRLQRYWWLLALVATFLGAQGIALLHAQTHGHSQDWISEHLGEHACAAIDQLASATPPSAFLPQLPPPPAAARLKKYHAFFQATESAAWTQARAPPVVFLKIRALEKLTTQLL